MLIGGPCVAIDPSGDALVETTDRIAIVTLDRQVVTDARRDYPGYLPVRARLYADAWAEIAATDGLSSALGVAERPRAATVPSTYTRQRNSPGPY